MNKDRIIKELLGFTMKEHDKIKQAYETTQNLVQQGDLKSDGKYDTRGTEANYLADGQRLRLNDLEQEIQLLQEVEIKDFTEGDEIAMGAVVEIEFNSITRKYFLAPTAGGTMLNIDGEVLLVISVFSPIGSEALGLNKGDTFELDYKGDVREYKIISVK